MFDNIRKLPFMEVFFRLVCLLFWPIYWYKWVVITIENYNTVLFIIFTVVDLIFVLFLLIYFITGRVCSKRYFLFQLSISITYFLTLLSFMIFNTSRLILYSQISACVISIIISWNLIKKEYNDIGVVGILSGLLILIVTYFY